MRFLKILLYILLILVVLIVIGIITLMYYVNPDRLKPVIIREVQRQTGYQLAIDGRMTWSFYPQVGMKIAHMTLAAPNQSAPFIDLKGVNVAADSMQFLHGREKLAGNIYISHITMDKLNLQDAHIGLLWQNNILTCQPITATAYQGSLSAVAHGRNLSNLPQWDWDARFEHVQLQPLMEDLNGVNSRIKIAGIGNISLRATTQGKSSQQVIQNLNGTSQFGVNQGTLLGVDLNYLIQAADAMLNKQTIGPPTTNQTAFNNFTGSAVIKNGIANLSQIVLTSSSFTANAQGNLNLPAQTVNLNVEVKPAQSIRTQWIVPMVVSGPLSNPDIRLNISEIQKTVVKQEIETVKTKVEDQIKKQIPKASELLHKFLGR